MYIIDIIDIYIYIYEMYNDVVGKSDHWHRFLARGSSRSMELYNFKDGDETLEGSRPSRGSREREREREREARTW